MGFWMNRVLKTYLAGWPWIDLGSGKEAGEYLEGGEMKMKIKRNGIK